MFYFKAVPLFYFYVMPISNNTFQNKKSSRHKLFTGKNL